MLVNSSAPGADRLWFLALGAWVVAILAGFIPLWLYEATPGATARLVASWPEDSRISASQERSTLVVFVHPYCPCSRASLAELSRVLDRVGDRVDTVVLFSVSTDSDEDVSESPLWSTAKVLPNTRLGLDEDGREARRFGATTSGHAVLYDRTGRVAFSGGLTSARGHEGESAGSKALLGLLNDDSSPRTAALETNVFGCSLRDEADQGAER